MFARKNNIMARLNGIQRAVAIKPSDFLLNLESELLKELDNVLNQEEEIWALKSRVNWIIQGDRNTAFYHVSTLVRRKRNQILAIKDSIEEWLYKDEAIKNVIRSGFNEVYSSSLSLMLLGLSLLPLYGKADCQMRKGRVVVGMLRWKRLKMPCGL